MPGQAPARAAQPLRLLLPRARGRGRTRAAPRPFAGAPRGARHGRVRERRHGLQSSRAARRRGRRAVGGDDDDQHRRGGPRHARRGEALARRRGARRCQRHPPLRPADGPGPHRPGCGQQPGGAQGVQGRERLDTAAGAALRRAAARQHRGAECRAGLELRRRGARGSRGDALRGHRAGARPLWHDGRRPEGAPHRRHRVCGQECRARLRARAGPLRGSHRAGSGGRVCLLGLPCLRWDGRCLGARAHQGEGPRSRSGRVVQQL
mmetsp:Transcript_4580/g.13609  ORF Transcript_4580/g.13609 Transcript_4580/m.13609 type:complete len:264 (-) Transcript_4580:63-854(-)